jgi:hypothetical protein
MGRRDQVQFLHVAGAVAKKALDTALISHYTFGATRFNQMG